MAAPIMSQHGDSNTDEQLTMLILLCHRHTKSGWLVVLACRQRPLTKNLCNIESPGEPEGGNGISTDLKTPLKESMLAHRSQR